jgi:hypothetical protein
MLGQVSEDKARRERNAIMQQFWAWRLKRKKERRQDRVQKAIENFKPVPGVAYRISPKTGLKRPVKPRPQRVS